MKKRIIDFTVYILLFALSISFACSFFNSDVYFDLKTGEYILENGIDFLDHFSIFGYLTYMYPHWLYDVLIFVILKLLNYNGLFIFFSWVVAITFIIMYEIIYKNTKSIIISSLICVITLLSSFSFFVYRVQVITYLLFLIELLLLEKLYKTNKLKYLILLIIDSIIIVNMHMHLWIFSIILTLPYLADSLLNKNIFKFTKSNYKLSTIIISILALIFSSFISIFHGIQFWFPFVALSSKGYKNILEMRPPSLLSYPLLIVLIVISLILIFKKGIKIKYKDLFMIVGILFFSCIAQRNVIYAQLIVPIYITNIYSYNKTINIKKTKINNNIIYPLIVFILLFSFINIYNSIPNNKNDFNTNEDSMVNYIKQIPNYQDIRIYNQVNDGPYLLYNDIKVLSDTRMEVYLKEFNGGFDIIPTIENNNFENIVELYNLNYYLSYSELDINDDWELIYQADGKYLYRKKDHKDINYCLLKE